MMYPSQFGGDDFIMSFAIISAEFRVFGSNPGLCFMEIFPNSAPNTLSEGIYSRP